MYLLVGATGLLGGRIAECLVAHNLPARALVRPRSDASALLRRGIEIARGDLREPATLAAALAGIDVVISTANAMGRSLAGDRTVSIHEVDEIGNANLVEEADRAGICRFVFISADRDELAARTPFTDAKVATEARLAAASFRTVIVRPEAFQEIWLSPLVGFDPQHGSVTIYGRGRSPMPYVGVDDTAEAVVRVATMAEPPRELVLAGPEALTAEQLVERWTELTGRPVKVSHVPRAVLAIGSRVLGPFKPALASTMGMALRSDTMTVTATDEGFQALGLRPRPVSQYLRGLAEATPTA